jgi:hypothetical protein
VCRRRRDRRSCVRESALEPWEEAEQADVTRDGIQTRGECGTGNGGCECNGESTGGTRGVRTYLGVCGGVVGVCGEWLRVLWWHLEL